MKIFLIGFMGSGKTYLGKLLGEKLGIPFIDLDEHIVSQEGKPITGIFASEGEEYFRLKEKEMLYSLTENHKSFVMACGGGTPCFFNNIEYMNQAGITVWLNTPTDILFARLIREKDHRPLISQLPDEQLKSYIQKKFADRKIYFEQAKVTVEEEPVQLDSLVQTLFHA